MPDILEEKCRNFLFRRNKDGNFPPILRSAASSENIPYSSLIANKLTKRSDCSKGDCSYVLHIQVYRHDSCEFATELKTRWEAFNRGI